MRFQEYMEETTKFAKAMQYFNGLKDFGVGMGIFTTMNPSAKEVSPEKNKKLYKDLLSLLKSKGNIKSTVPGKGKVEVFKNPTSRDKKSLGNIIRFTAYNKTKTVYAWVYDQAHHHDVSKAVGIKHRFNDPDLLTGVATWKGGKWVWSSSDFLKDFKKMVGSEGEFLDGLLNNDWSWVTSFLDLDHTLDKLREYLKGKL